MPRIAYPDAASGLPDVQPNGARTLNVERMMMHLDPAIRESFTALGTGLLWRGTLDPALRELAIVRVGLLSNAPYEVHHHDALALQVGVPQSKLDALREPEIGAVFSAEEKAILLFTDELVRNVRPGDEALAGVQRYLTSGQIMEMVIATGLYMVVSRVLETFGVDLDDFGLDATPR